MRGQDSYPSIKRNTLSAAVALGLAGAAMAGCADPSESKEQPVIVFDDLGGGSPTIFVYQGPGESPADKEVAGSFNSGNMSAVECATLGRLITSDPSVGEENVSSDEWYSLADGTFASDTYADPAPGSVPIPPC